MRQAARIAGLVMAALAFGAPAIAQPESASGREDIVIGATCAVTGQLASTGLTVLRALEMAVEDVNAAGGVNGKRLRLVNEDAGASSSSAVTALIKVAAEKPAAMFLSSFSPQVLAAAGEVARLGLPAFHAAGAVEIEELGNPWLFRLKPNDRINTEAVASVIADDLGRRKPGLIYVQNDYGQGFAQLLKQALAKRGIPLVEESYGTTDNDMAAQLQRLAAAGIDVLVTAGFNRDSALVLRERKALGLNVPVVGQQALTVAGTVDLLSAEELADVYGLTDALLAERTAFDRADFVRRYEARNPFKVDPSFIANSYDAVMILAEAMRAVGEDPARVRDYIAGLDGFEGVTRRYVAGEKGNLASDVVIVRYDDTKTPAPVRVYGADAPPQVQTVAPAAAPAVIDRAEVVVGATIPITGPSASSGLLYYRALQMAEEDINAAGGINGVPFRFAFEDAQSSNSTAVSAFIKVVQDHKPVAAFISSFTPQNFAVEAEVRRAAIPTFYAGGADGIAALGNPWLFRIKQPDSIVAAAMVDVALNELKARRPAVMYAQNDYGQGMAAEIERRFAAAGVPLIVESFAVDENEFGSHLLAVTGRGADVLLSVGYVRDTALMLGTRRTLGLKIPVVSNPTLAVPSTLALVTPADIDGAYGIVDSYLAARRSFDRTGFMARYEQRFNIPADPSFVTNYYDAALLLADAVRAVGTDPEALRGYLARLDGYDGITRTYAADAQGNLGSSATIVKFRPGAKDYDFVREFRVTADTAGAQAAAAQAALSQAPAESQRSPRLTAALQTLFNGLAIGCIYALMALGFVLVYEATGVVNFAAGQFVVVGAFLGVSSIASLGGAAALGAVAAIAAMVVLGMLFFVGVYRPLQKSPVVTVVVGTIAVGIIVQNVSLLVWGPLPQRLASPFGVEPLSLGGVVVSTHIIAVIAITVVVVAGLYALLYRTVLGARMRAVAQDAEAARLMGINVAGIYALTWALAGGLAGLGGVLMGPVWFVDTTMGDALALKAFASTIIGGFGNVPGAIVGGVIVGLAESLGAAYVSSTYKDAIVFLLMVAFLVARPQGIFGEYGGDRG
ncbi:MAG: ABC transporter substrate-binding protein [Rhodospirillaceae bacterium]|nr:ABC transporter substrate-binding protein [Rhodospirillaceae bacterium]